MKLRPHPFALPRFCSVGLVACTALFAPSFVSQPARAQLIVEDIGANFQLGYTEVENVIRHVEDIAKYVTMIENQVETLKRFGDPNTYVGMLGLTKLQAEIQQIRQGIGQSLSDLQNSANGLRSMQYTGQGLYQDISKLPDRYGQKVNFDANRFKKFDVTSQLAEQYDKDLTEYNRRIKTLANQYGTLMNKLNSASSQMETEKIQGQLSGVATQMNAAGQILHASADRFNVHTTTVNQMAQRDAEAKRQRGGLYPRTK